MKNDLQNYWMRIGVENSVPDPVDPVVPDPPDPPDPKPPPQPPGGGRV